MIENNRLCDTCGKDMNMCEGHNSHLRLADQYLIYVSSTNEKNIRVLLFKLYETIIGSK